MYSIRTPSNVPEKWNFSQQSITDASATIQTSDQASGEERLKAAEYLARYEAAVALVLSEARLTTDQRDKLNRNKNSVASVLEEAKVLLPGMKAVARYPALKSNRDDRERFLDAYHKDLERLYEQSKESGDK